jgi:hypothetical protein
MSIQADILLFVFPEGGKRLLPSRRTRGYFSGNQFNELLGRYPLVTLEPAEDE